MISFLSPTPPMTMNEADEEGETKNQGHGRYQERGI